jgi:hypothetical protein
MYISLPLKLPGVSRASRLLLLLHHLIAIAFLVCNSASYHQQQLKSPDGTFWLLGTSFILRLRHSSVLKTQTQHRNNRRSPPSIFVVFLLFFQSHFGLKQFNYAKPCAVSLTSAPQCVVACLHSDGLQARAACARSSSRLAWCLSAHACCTCRHPSTGTQSHSNPIISESFSVMCIVMEVSVSSVLAACPFDNPTIQILEFSPNNLLPRLTTSTQPNTARPVLRQTFATL